MKKLWTLRSILSLLLLLLVVNTFVSTLKDSLRDGRDAAFVPITTFAVIISFALGFSAWSTRRVWSIVMIGGLIIAFIESAGLAGPIKNILASILHLELELIYWVFEKKVPDLFILQTHFTTITSTTAAFALQVLSASLNNASVREFFWDIPLLSLAAWAGWQISRRNQTLLALAPLLGFQAVILDYTGNDTFSLQLTVFALILLFGLNQKWNFTQQAAENSGRAARETYPAIILLSIVLAFTAGVFPSISIKKVAKELARKNELANAIGLEKKITRAFEASGLPREHLVGLSPTLAKTVVFTVKTGEMAPSESAFIIKETAPRHYWRWLTYDIYNGHGWATSPIDNHSYSANESLLPISEDKHHVIHLEVEKVLTQDNRLYWTGSLANVTQPYNASWRTSPESLSPSDDPLLSADMLGAITEEKIYQADALVPIVSANQLRASSEIYPPQISLRYLALPDTVPQRVRDLAKELTANLSNPYDKMKAIETYLRTFPYTLDVQLPPADRDIVDYFLFDLKTGYCDYYATAMIVLARSLNIPSRMVIGYANGNYDPIHAEYVVLEADAHSWVEVYFPGTGWVEFEPTASQPQITLPNELPRKNIAAEQSAIAHTKKGFFPERTPFPFGFTLASIILLLIGWFFHVQGLLKSHKTISSIYEYIYYHGNKICGDTLLINETPSIFANKLMSNLGIENPRLTAAPGEIKLLTDLYLQETYSAHPIKKAEQALAIKVWRNLFWRLLYARVMHLLQPASFSKTSSHAD